MSTKYTVQEFYSFPHSIFEGIISLVNRAEESRCTYVGVAAVYGSTVYGMIKTGEGPPPTTLATWHTGRVSARNIVLTLYRSVLIGDAHVFGIDMALTYRGLWQYKANLDAVALFHPPAADKKTILTLMYWSIRVYLWMYDSKYMSYRTFTHLVANIDIKLARFMLLSHVGCMYMMRIAERPFAGAIDVWDSVDTFVELATRGEHDEKFDGVGFDIEKTLSWDQSLDEQIERVIQDSCVAIGNALRNVS